MNSFLVKICRIFLRKCFASSLIRLKSSAKMLNHKTWL